LILSLSTLGLALGEELWLAYLPKYLVGLGASSLVVGAFASLRDFLDGAYQYPGGWLTDHLGRKRALMIFTAAAICGYVFCASANHWWMVFAGFVLVMAWKSGAFPTSFAIIGDALPYGKRGFAFSIVSILQRFPRVIGAPVGGMMLAGLGIIVGVKFALAITIGLALLVLSAQFFGFQESIHAFSTSPKQPVRIVFRSIPSSLKRLLVVECLVRFGEAMSLSFIVLYVTNVLNFSVAQYGLLFALQQFIAVSMYLPSGRLADLTGRKPIIALTFFCFAFFPLAIAWAGTTNWIIAAFAVGGLKEFGEPARKSYIVDEAPPELRGRVVGLYYTMRNLSIVPAGLIGGLLWSVSPAIPLVATFGLALVGLLLFLRRSE
jgi:MFS family permease